MNVTQDRRPGLRKFADAIARMHPDWTKEHCAAVAKSQWTMQIFDQLAIADRRDLKAVQDNVRITARKSL